MTAADTVVVDKPGLYELDESVYHRDAALAPAMGRSLSVSGAKTLLASPARFVHEREHGRSEKRVFDLGTLAHALILHSGDARIRIIDAYDWRTKAAQQAKRDAYAAGQVPVHRGDLRAVAPLRQAVKRHPLASAILSQGVPERSMYWTDPETGITMRGRIDWVRDNALVDVKTVPYGGTDDAALAKAAANFDWPMQAANYTDGWEAITGDRLPFLFLAIEKEPPYLIRVVQLDDDALEVGRDRMRLARERFALYETDGYPTVAADIDTLAMPRWYAAH